MRHREGLDMVVVERVGCCRSVCTSVIGNDGGQKYNDGDCRSTMVLGNQPSLDFEMGVEEEGVLGFKYSTFI